MESQRYFTVAEINGMIPDLEARVRAILEQRREVNAKAAALHARKSSSGPADDFMQEEAELEFIVMLLRSAYAGIEELGGVIKQPDATLIDFLGRGPDGEDVWLCWRYGEKELLYYHPIDEGFSGRRPVTGAM